MCDRLLGAGLLESTWGGCRYSKQRKREMVCKEKRGDSEKVGVLPHHNGRGRSKEAAGNAIIITGRGF